MLITIEEGSIGGFGSAVLHHLAWKGLLDSGLKVRPMVLPDLFIDHDFAGEAARRGEADARRTSWPRRWRRSAIGEALRRRPGDHREVGDNHLSSRERSAQAICNRLLRRGAPRNDKA